MRIRRIIRLEPGDCVVVCSKRSRNRPIGPPIPTVSTTYSVTKTYKPRRKHFC